MRNFFYKSLLFLLLPMSILLFSDITLRMQNTLHKEKYEGAKEVIDSIEVLILGTSHAHYAVNPEVFDLYAYNLANLGQSIYFDKRITLSLLPEMKQLKYVFISIDYHSLAFSSQFDKDYWSYYGNGIKYKDTNYLYANLSPTLFGYTPRVAYSMHKNRYLKIKEHGTDIIDFEVQNGVDLYKPAVKGYVAFEDRDLHNFNHDAYNVSSSWYTEVIENSNERDEIIADLEHFVQLLLANDITPILITAPVYSEYIEYLNSSYIEENIYTSNQIAYKHGLKYWDFLNSERFTIDDFYDMEHLNRKGALKFSNMLNDSINTMKSVLKAYN